MRRDPGARTAVEGWRTQGVLFAATAAIVEEHPRGLRTAKVDEEARLRGADVVPVVLEVRVAVDAGVRWNVAA
jgi:hypothetical protein